jgi:hypothetical protein
MVVVGRGWRDGEMERWRDGEMERSADRRSVAKSNGERARRGDVGFGNRVIKRDLIF